MTKQEISKKVLSNVGRHWVQRILLLLLDRQTLDEQQNETTSHNNARGFSGTDGMIGTSHAKNIRRRGFITEGEYNFWIKESRGGPRIAKYWKQINEEIEAKKNQQAA